MPFEKRYAVGTVVQLRSGGFHMTIIGHACGDAVHVTWATSTGSDGLELREQFLPLKALQPAGPDDIPF